MVGVVGGGGRFFEVRARAIITELNLPSTPSESPPLKELSNEAIATGRSLIFHRPSR